MNVIPPRHILLMDMIIWNCNGAASRSFLCTLKDVIHRYKPGILGLTDNRRMIFAISGVGIMGPGSVPLLSQPSSRAPKGLNPKASQSRNARPILRPGLGPKASRPRNAWSILRPGARTPFYPGTYFPDRQLHQMKLPTGSSCYKCRFSHEPTSSPLIE